MHWKRTLSLGLIVLLLTNCFLSCNSRRNNIKDGLDGSETTDSVNTSFYDGMSESDMLDLYANHTVLASSTSHSVINTPYYYIIANSGVPGGSAFSKLSNTLITMCTDSYCEHQECLFSKDIEEYIVHGNRIYYLVSEHPYIVDPTLKYSLYSTDLLFLDVRLEYEFPTSVEAQYEIIDNGGGNIGLGDTMFLATITHPCFYENKVYYNDYIVNTDGDIIETIYILDLDTKTNGVMLNDTMASRLSIYGSVLSWNDEDGNEVHYDLATNQYVEDYTPPTTTVTLSSDYRLTGRVVCEEYSYVMVDHATTMFTDDPYFSYYTSSTSSTGYFTLRDASKRSGGDIYRVKTDGSDGGVPELLVTLSTDGIPDVVYWFYTDGKTLFVCYETYLDFENEYNTNMNDDAELSWTDKLVDKYYYKYAIVDLETKTVYKPEA